LNVPKGLCVLACAAVALSGTLHAQTSSERLLDAIRRGDRATVERLIAERANVNAAEADGTTALNRAAGGEDVEIVALLIKGGADVHAANQYGVTPLTTACAMGNRGIVDLLLKSGADANSRLPEGETVLMTAARTGRLDIVRALLTRGSAVNAVEAWRGQTALMWAAGEGHTETAQELIRAGADVQIKSKGGFTALLFAVRGGHTGTARALAAAGANVNDRAADGSSALGVAVINAHFETAAMLLEHGADPNAPDPRGSVLHALTWMRNPGYAAAPPRLPTGKLNGLDLAKALLERGANPNVRIAWKEIRFDRDLGMVKSPPDISIGRDYLSYVGATPFYVAAKGADVPLMKLLLEHGADPLIPTAQRVTPLMAAAGLGFWDGESPGPESGVPESQALEAVKIALEAGNDVNAVTDFGSTPIEGDGVTLLRRHPLNLPAFGEDALGDMRWGGSTALHGAAIRGADSIIRFLVERGARVDARNKLGWTPLTVAQGVFVANTEKAWPSTIALLKELQGGAQAAPVPRAPR
jgi:ankyrin repeat protein